MGLRALWVASAIVAWSLLAWASSENGKWIGLGVTYSRGVIIDILAIPVLIGYGILIELWWAQDALQGETIEEGP